MKTKSIPLFSGAHKYVLFFGLGATAFHFIEQYRINYFAERDAIYRHYIQLHPDDFVTPGKSVFLCQRFSTD